MRHLFAAILCLIAAQSAAQDVLTNTIVNGQRVEVLSDFTWRYADPDAVNSECDVLSPIVTFCSEALGYQAMDAPQPDIKAMYQLNDRNYAMFVIESIGRNDGMTMKLMNDVVLQNASDGSGAKPEDIPVFDGGDQSIDDEKLTTMIYAVEFNGFPFIFYNSIWIGDAETLQAITYAVGAAPTDALLAKHQAFLDQIDLKL